MLEYTQKPELQDKSLSLLLDIIEESDTKIDENGQRRINSTKIINQAAHAGERDAILQKGLHELASHNTEEGFNLVHKASLEGHPTAPMFEAISLWTKRIPIMRNAMSFLKSLPKRGSKIANYI